MSPRTSIFPLTSRQLVSNYPTRPCRSFLPTFMTIPEYYHGQQRSPAEAIPDKLVPQLNIRNPLPATANTHTPPLRRGVPTAHPGMVPFYVHISKIGIGSPPPTFPPLGHPGNTPLPHTRPFTCCGTDSSTSRPRKHTTIFPPRAPDARGHRCGWSMLNPSGSTMIPGMSPVILSWDCSGQFS